jgi:hypothetical protein
MRRGAVRVTEGKHAGSTNRPRVPIDLHVWWRPRECLRPREDSNLRTRFRNRPGTVFAERLRLFVQVSSGRASGGSILFLPVSSS